MGDLAEVFGPDSLFEESEGAEVGFDRDGSSIPSKVCFFERRARSSRCRWSIRSSIKRSGMWCEKVEVDSLFKDGETLQHPRKSCLVHFEGVGGSIGTVGTPSWLGF